MSPAEYLGKVKQLLLSSDSAAKENAGKQAFAEFQVNFTLAIPLAETVVYRRPISMVLINGSKVTRLPSQNTKGTMAKDKLMRR